MHRLDHLDPGFPRHLAAERRPLFPIQLHHRQPRVLNRLGHLIQLRIDKNPNNLALPPKSSSNPHRLVRLNAPRTIGEVDQPNSPSPKPHSLSRIIQIGDPTDLDPHEPSVRESGPGVPREHGSRPGDAPFRSDSGLRRGTPGPPHRDGTSSAESGRTPRVTMIVLLSPSRSTVNSIFRRRSRVDRVDHLFHPADLLAVDLCDHVAAEPEAGAFDRRRGVAALDARLVGRAALDDFVDEHAFFDRQLQRLGQVGGDAAAADPEVGVLDFAVLLDLLHDFARGVDRHREADADVAAAAAAGLDLGVDPDHAARAVDQRPAGVAGVDRRVGLDHVRDREAVGGLDLALDRGDDAGGDGRSSPNGLPIATTCSPTSTFEESPSESGWSCPAGASTLSSATSVAGSVPTTSAV